jgi:hypothetical protein
VLEVVLLAYVPKQHSFGFDRAGGRDHPRS